jgi:AbrB family looped-hinge helix DNA binding protein
MPTAKLTSKGQITIPIEVRNALGLEAGDKIDFFEIEKGKYGLRPRTGSIMDMKGCIPPIGRSVSIEEMNEAIGQAAVEGYLRGLDAPAPASSEGAAA